MQIWLQELLWGGRFTADYLDQTIYGGYMYRNALANCDDPYAYIDWKTLANFTAVWGDGAQNSKFVSSGTVAFTCYSDDYQE